MRRRNIGRVIRDWTSTGNVYGRSVGGLLLELSFGGYGSM